MMAYVDRPSPTLQTRQAQQERPVGPPAMYQSWQELLFLHWSCDPEVIQSTLPEGLTVDTFDDRAWVAVVPFFMRNIRPRWSPVVPGLSHFQELNLRTYVIDRHGTPGVWFYSLDANSRVAVWWGSTFYRLPYHSARMTNSWDRTAGRVQFTSQRRAQVGDSVNCRFEYVPSGPPAPAAMETLEYFLVERYVLFARAAGGALWSGRVHHPPYEVSPAQARFEIQGLFEASGLPPRTEPAEHVLVSRGVDVDVFPLRRTRD